MVKEDKDRRKAIRKGARLSILKNGRTADS